MTITTSATKTATATVRWIAEHRDLMLKRPNHGAILNRVWVLWRSLRLPVEKVALDLSGLQAPVFERLGRGLSAFSQIESHLAFLFAQLMEPADRKMSLLAFDAIVLTAPKVRALTAVAKAKLSDKQFAALSKILKRVNARTEMRIKLAHWTVTFWHPEMPLKMYDEKTEARVLPPCWSGKNLDFSPDESLSSKEIDQFISKCGQVSGELVMFMTTL